MDITAILAKATDAEFREVMDAATPVENMFLSIARSGVHVYTSEMCPPGVWIGYLDRVEVMKDEG